MLDTPGVVGAPLSSVERRDGFESPPVADSPGPHPHRRRRVVMAALVLVVMLAGALLAIVWWGGSSGRELTVDQARRRLGTATSLPAQPRTLRPAQGVYLYRGSGTDALSTPAKQQTEGPDMPATVAHRADGCWTFRIDYHSNHWQNWIYCPTTTGLDEAGGETYQKWDFGVFVSETRSRFDCASSETIRIGARPGDSWTQTCASAPGSDGPASSTSGPYRFVGRELLRIGAANVASLRYHRDRTMSGGQRGTERSDVWFAESDGLPVRNQRRLEVRTDTIIGETSYSENASFELVRRP